MFIFYSEELQDNNIVLREDEHIHCSKVLRKKKGDTIHITDGKGTLFFCTITDISKSHTICVIDSSKTEPINTVKYAIAISPLKNASRLEWFVEKAVEIGIDDLYIVYFARTEKRLHNTTRLQKIAISAMKQSMNLVLPKITVCNRLEELFEKSTAYHHKYVGWCEGNPPLLSIEHQKNEGGLVIIGPEGDLTQDEISYVHIKNCKTVSLGKSRLRTETAGLLALFMLKS